MTNLLIAICLGVAFYNLVPVVLALLALPAVFLTTIFLKLFK